MKIREKKSPGRLALCGELRYAEPSFGPIGEDIIERSYARIKEDGELESWTEMCERIAHGNCNFVDEKDIEEGEREELLQALLSLAIIPAGRHIRNTGVIDRQFVHNCHTTGWVPSNPFEHFSFTMRALMHGGGVGSNYSSKYIDKMPKVKFSPDVRFICREDHPDFSKPEPVEGDKPDYRTRIDSIVHPGKYEDLLVESKIDPKGQKSKYIMVKDSREGWIKTTEEVYNYAWGVGGYTGKEVLYVDVSNVREFGANLKSFGGTASGPVVLMEMLIESIDVFKNALMSSSAESASLSPLDYMLLDHAIAVCVCSGGSRRSSRMSMLHWKDPFILDFINSKSGQGFPHWTTNISVIIDDEYVERLLAEDKYVSAFHLEICKRMIEKGEPGFWNISNASRYEIEELFATNPCGEQGLNFFDACDLGHHNMYMMHLYPKSQEAILRLLTRFLIRATYADMTSNLQEETVQKNRRIGVGFLGFADYVALQGMKYSESHENEELRATFRKWYSIIEDEAHYYSFRLRIPVPVTLTTVAPTGSTCFIPGVTPGCQPIKFRYFKRRVQMSDSSAKLKEKIEQGFHVEPSYAKNTSVVTYWLRDNLIKRLKDEGRDVSVVETDSEVGLKNMLKVQSMIQEEWADNSVSFTITLPQRIVKDADGNPIPDEDPDNPMTKGKLLTECLVTPEELAETWKEFLPVLKGSTVVQEGSYVQMPYERCTEEKWREMTKGMTDTSGGAEIQCANGSCDLS